ncbi:hypothetical protein E2562_008354 [Oryza meyeriana var. granulata]|uniref:Uncharacterized protein n=1 Tax=Oryza meyeriana var. granulata TaxID=110450 RepID=A0A6G1EHD5_9ORYZ|nr:hypothetical protein E2562_008354 [Oryza meyeriana var. granulata]
MAAAQQEEEVIIVGARPSGLAMAALTRLWLGTRSSRDTLLSLIVLHIPFHISLHPVHHHAALPQDLHDLARVDDAVHQLRLPGQH